MVGSLKKLGDFKFMTVEQLIEKLRTMPPDKEVKFSYNYGDYWRTIVAAPVQRVDQLETVYSDYHRMDKIADRDDDNKVECVILS